MIRAPSLIRAFDDFYSADPAFIQPPAELGNDATDAEKEEYERALADYRAKILSAKETGKWDAALVPGAVPTKFVLQPVDRNIWREILDRGSLPADSSRRIGIVTAIALLFRLSLKSIVGFDLKVERAADPQWDGWVMAQPDVITVLDELDAGIVSEIGGGIYKRLMGIGPKP